MEGSPLSGSAYDESIIFTAAMRRNVVDWLLLLAMWQVAPMPPVEEWADEAAMFFRDLAPTYPHNPLSARPHYWPKERITRRRGTCSMEFVEWFTQHWYEHKGLDWPRRIYTRYDALVGGHPAEPPEREAHRFPRDPEGNGSPASC